MAPLQNSFGAQLRRLRQAAGLTQEQLAERAGLTEKAISALERGERQRPYPHTVEALAAALELGTDERGALMAAVPRRTNIAGAPSREGAGSTTAVVAPPELIGREREIAAVADLLSSGATRLVTLTGPGGVGKTVLALAVVAEIRGHFPDDVVFVGLAPLRDPALVIPTIASTMGVREAGGQTLREALLTYLRDKQTLLVLDNFEHVLEAVPEVAELLAACPRLVVLVTSRAPLRLRGEQEYPVGPLALPELSRVPVVEDVAAAASVQLFAQRARQVAPAFTLTRANAAAVAAICRRLDGLPLALELAAARARFLSPTELLARLDHALPLLVGGARDLPERQQTMRRAIEWSYDLLDESERALFRKMSVFAGGWTLEAAETVGAGTARGVEDVLDMLGRLVEQSLVVAEPAGEEIRYRMLEPVREYAQEQLAAVGETDMIRRRHAHFFLAFAGAVVPELKGPQQVMWYEWLQAEHDNFRATMAWLIEAGEAEGAARIGGAIWLFWWVRGYQREGRRWMEEVLTCNLSPAPRMLALTAAGPMAYAEGDYEACDRYCREALALAQTLGDMARIGHACIGLALVALHRLDYEQAAAHLEAARAPLRAASDYQMLSFATNHLGTLWLMRGDYERAAPIYEEALTLAQRLGDRTTTNVTLYNLALVDQARGDWTSATRRFAEGVTLSLEMGDRANLAHCLEGLGVMAGMQGDAQRAARLLGAAEALIEAVGAAVYNYYRPDRTLYERAVSDARSRLGERGFEAAWAEGRMLTSEQMAAIARQLVDSPAADVTATVHR